MMMMMMMMKLRTVLALLCSTRISYGFTVSHQDVLIVARARTCRASWWATPPTTIISPSSTSITSSTSSSSSSSSTQLHLKSTSKDDDAPSSSSFSFHPPFAVAWVALVAWAFSSAAPGSLGSPEDTAMLNAIMADPAHPVGMNELYYAVFNFFVVVPFLIASLALPQSQSKKGIPALPFLLASSGIGYFAIGPYLAFRAPPINSIQEKTEPMSWFTKNILESKIFSAGLLAFTLYLFVGAGVVDAYQQDAAALWQGFVDTVSTSRFAAVSLADLTLLYASSVALTPRDYRLRNPEASQQDATIVALSTALLPCVGSLLYLVLRPSLPQQEE